mmetsp:Transcript_16919/g.39072  ORF Transcript_16919/g.39072 Transcript_16919/m.39072 type:complete len:1001 (-) Transcript_16919:47-3049(-)
MPLRLEIKKKLQARSDRVKCVDVHPVEPWVLSALYNGKVILWDYDSGSMIKSFDICDLPVRSAKFVARKQWFVTASDDMHIRVFNYNTMEKVKEFEAHADYIRYIEVHPSLPYVISASDDMSMKLWKWDENWNAVNLFEGHAHYVMMVKFNPKDTNTFATASLDRTIKVWGLSSQVPHFSLEGHTHGVNCIDFYPGGDKPYLLSGADDKTVKIWDYQTKACVQTLEGHMNNVCSVCFHPRLPILVSGSEDGTVRLWHSVTYRAETTLNYGMERAWSLAVMRDSNKLAIGYDEGTVVLKLGQEQPVASLDSATGKIVYALNNEIQTASLRGTGAQCDTEGIADGERLPLAAKDMGSTEVFPQTIKHNNNGRFIVVCGDGEYIVYTSQALRNKTFGQALDFCWSAVATGDYAVRESIGRVKIFKNFKEHKSIKAPISSMEGLYGGHCLAILGPDCVVFYDWNDGNFIRKIDVVAKSVLWNEAGTLCCIVTEDTSYVLKFDAAATEQALASGQGMGEDGVEGAFDFAHELTDKVATGVWVGDCFLFTNAANRLNYFVGGEVITLCHLDHTMYLLGYLAKEDRAYLIDNGRNVVSFRVLQSVLQFQTAVVRGDMAEANSLIAHIPESEHNSVARFLEGQGLKEEALAITKDPDQKFDLALELGQLETAYAMMGLIKEADLDTTDTQSKWKRLGDLALSKGDLGLAKRCAESSGDVAGLLLLHTAVGDAEGTKALALQAKELGKTNVAFMGMFLLGEVEGCVDLLVETGRIPEAAFLARTYMPSLMPNIVAVWKEDLAKVSDRAAKALADPQEYPNLFPDLDTALQVEAYFTANRGALPPAKSYPTAHQELDLDLISLFKQKAAAMAAQTNAKASAEQEASQEAAAAEAAGKEAAQAAAEAEAAAAGAEAEAQRKAAEEAAAVAKQKAAQEAEAAAAAAPCRGKRACRGGKKRACRLVPGRPRRPWRPCSRIWPARNRPPLWPTGEPRTGRARTGGADPGERGGG